MPPIDRKRHSVVLHKVIKDGKTCGYGTQREAGIFTSGLQFKNRLQPLGNGALPKVCPMAMQQRQSQQNPRCLELDCARRLAMSLDRAARGSPGGPVTLKGRGFFRKAGIGQNLNTGFTKFCPTGSPHKSSGIEDVSACSNESIARQANIVCTCEHGFDILDHSTSHYLLGVARCGVLWRLKFAADGKSIIFRDQQISSCSGRCAT
jgi:hypothetical protein